MEVWKKIKEFENYEISNLGRVKSINKEIILKHRLSKNNYFIINLYKNKKRETKYIHQLVAISFLNHIPCGHKLVVNHKNFIRTDNRVENLEIITQRENSNKKHLKSVSKYTGVSKSSNTNKFESRIVINGKLKYLGIFDNEIEANKHYNIALNDIELGNEIKVKKHCFSSIYKGVSFYKNYNKWTSFIIENNKTKNLGYFDTEIEAYNNTQKHIEQQKLKL